MANIIFTPEFLKEIGFIPVTKYISEDFNGIKTSHEVKPPYGRATDIRTGGMTILTWNNEGHNMTYFGDKLEPNVSFSIGKDGGTRKAFAGYVYNQDEVRFLLKRTW